MVLALFPWFLHTLASMGACVILAPAFGTGLLGGVVSQFGKPGRYALLSGCRPPSGLPVLGDAHMDVIRGRVGLFWLAPRALLWLFHGSNCVITNNP